MSETLREARELTTKKVSESQIALNEYIREYLAGYEYRCEACITPSEPELTVMEDAIQGLLADEKFIGIFRNLISQRTVLRLITVK